MGERGGPPDFWQRVAVRERSAPEYLTAEELVGALRQFLSRGDRRSAHRIAEELIERWGHFVLARAWTWFPHSEADRQELRQEVWSRLWQEVANPQKSYWEQNFWVAMTHLCLDVRRMLTKPSARGPWGTWEEGVLLSPRDEDREPAVSGPLDLIDPSPNPLDTLLRAEGVTWLIQAFPRLPPQVQRALFLRYIQGWPVSSRDCDTVTISAVLGVDRRTVRNYLKHGLELLREWHKREHADGQA